MSVRSLACLTNDEAERYLRITGTDGDEPGRAALIGRVLRRWDECECCRRRVTAAARAHVEAFHRERGWSPPYWANSCPATPPRST